MSRNEELAREIAVAALSTDHNKIAERIAAALDAAEARGRDSCCGEAVIDLAMKVERARAEGYEQGRATGYAEGREMGRHEISYHHDIDVPGFDPNCPNCRAHVGDVKVIRALRSGGEGETGRKP